MFDRIVIPIDGRRGSAEAVRFAARLARVHDAVVLACYVVDRRLIGRAFVNLREAMRAELEAEGRGAVRRAVAVCRRAGVECRTVLAEGEPVAEIVALARRERADLLVMRTSGRGALGALLLGSPAPRLVGRVPCPVLLVRSGTGTRRRRARARARAKRRA